MSCKDYMFYEIISWLEMKHNKKNYMNEWSLHNFLVVLNTNVSYFIPNMPLKICREMDGK